MSKLRKCVTCKCEKPATLEFFYKDKNRKLGLMYRCKECDKKRTSKQDRTNRWSEMTDEQKRNKYDWGIKYRKTLKGKAISLISAYRKIDFKKGYDFNITQEYMINSLKRKCVYCKYPSTGLDRINNQKGHTEDNVVSCCTECNIARMDNFTHEEMFTLGKTIKKIKDER